MHTWQTADVFEPSLQMPQRVNQNAPPSVKLDLVDDLLQQVPRWIEPGGVRGPIQEEAVQTSGARIVQRGGVDRRHLGHSASERVHVDAGLEDGFCAGQQLTLHLGRQTPKVGTAES